VSLPSIINKPYIYRMKNPLTTKQLRLKYDPDSILQAIETCYENNLDKLRNSIGHHDSPLCKYREDLQISFLENQQKNNDIVGEVASLLKDTIYFMLLPKKQRTDVTKTMRTYYTELVKNQLFRIKILLEDDEIGMANHETELNSKHKGVEQVFSILNMLKKTLEYENDYRKKLTRSSYLTGLQVSMGRFFIFLNKINMNQGDQITLVQRMFDDFNVDWKEGDRENIKLSLIHPALDFYKTSQDEILSISVSVFSKNINDVLMSNIVDQSIQLKKRLRRF